MSERQAFNRAGHVPRGIGRRGDSSRIRQSEGPSLSLSDAAKAHRAADMVKAKAKRHYAKHRETWVAKRYGELLQNSGNTLTLTPTGTVSDPKAALMAKASNQIAGAHSSRLARIETARENAMHGRAVRATRKIDWGCGLEN